MSSFHEDASGVRVAHYTRKMIDEELFCTWVLRSSPGLNEDQLDQRLEDEARALGLQCRTPCVDRFPPSITVASIASRSEKPSSMTPQSAQSTLCCSSERRKSSETRQIHTQARSPTRSVTPPLHSSTDKGASNFRNGFRRMSLFRKRRSGASRAHFISTNPSHGSEDGCTGGSCSANESSESPGSTPSRDSSWSTDMSPMSTVTAEESITDDMQSTSPTKECAGSHQLQLQQQVERHHFLEFQNKCLDDMRSGYENSKKQKIEAQAAAVREKRNRDEESIADLECRQLQAEMKLIGDLESERRTCVIRLRHMEAYCHSPSALVGAKSSSSSPSRSTPPAVPVRTITDKDFRVLAQQYRERDAMENLHRSRIEVLRGRQEKQYSDYVAKKAREIDKMEAEHREAVRRDDLEAQAKEEGLILALAEKMARLERRWRWENMIESAKQQKMAGVRSAMPPDIEVGDA